MYHYNSVREARRFCQRGGPTIEGSTPISEQPELKPEQQKKIMYVIKTSGKDEELTLLAVDETNVDMFSEKIMFFPYYLAAEEYCMGSNRSAMGVDELFKLMSAEYAKLITECSNLRDDIVALKNERDAH